MRTGAILFETTGIAVKRKLLNKKATREALLSAFLCLHGGIHFIRMGNFWYPPPPSHMRFLRVGIFSFFMLVGWCSLLPCGSGCVAGHMLTSSKIENQAGSAAGARGYPTGPTARAGRAADEGPPVSAVGAASVRPQPTRGGDGPTSPCVRFALPEKGVPTPEQRACSKKR